MSRIGFSQNQSETTSRFYEQFIGQPGDYSVGQVSATGVLKEVNFKEGFIAVQPSIVAYDGRVRYIKDRPTIITLGTGQPLSFRPLDHEDIQTIIDEQEKQLKVRELRRKRALSRD